MAHFNIVVPVKVGERTHYRRVGALFENVSRETGEVFYRMRMDFPVGATEMLAFPPRAGEDEAAQGEGAAGRAHATGTAAT